MADELSEYDKECLAKCLKRQRKLEQIAQCLGWEWTLDVETSRHERAARYFQFLGPEGTILSIHWDNGRINLGVNAHRKVEETGKSEYLAHHLPQNLECPSITCAFDRAASDIAADMRRRLIPGAISYTKQMLVAFQKWKDKKTAAWNVLQQIREALTGQLEGQWGQVEWDHPDRASISLGRYDDMLHAKAKYSDYNDEVSFEISVRRNLGLALELCHWLAEHK